VLVRFALAQYYASPIYSDGTEKAAAEALAPPRKEIA